MLKRRAQQTGSLTIHGLVLHKQSISKAVKIEAYKDNELQQAAENLSSGSFKLTLELGSVYNVSFFKSGYIEKSIAAVAKTESSISISGRFFYQLDIELFKEGDGNVDETAHCNLRPSYTSMSNQHGSRMTRNMLSGW